MKQFLTFVFLCYTYFGLAQSNVTLINDILSKKTQDKLKIEEKKASEAIYNAVANDTSSLKVDTAWSDNKKKRKLRSFDNKKYNRYYWDYWFENSIIKEVNLYGAGGILSAASGSDKPDGSSPVNGSLGISFNFGDRQAWSIYYSYNGVKSIDINSYEQLGRTLLTPLTNGNAFILSWVYNPKWLPRRLGTTVNITLADNIWNYGDTAVVAPEQPSTVSTEISPILFKAGFFWKPFPFDLISNKVNFILSASYTYRGAFGDLHNGYKKEIYLSDEEQFYTLRAYQGMEFAAHLLVNSVDLYFQIPINFTDVEISGFGGAQVVFGLNISGEFIKVK